jgi:ribosomal protein S18 acetylase RimI-like enzyme
LTSDAKLAIWTRDGGVVACSGNDAGEAVGRVIAEHDGHDAASLLARLQETVGDTQSYLNVLLSCIAPVSHEHPAVEMLPVEAIWPEGNGDVEHVFAIRTGAVPARCLSPVPVVEGSAFSRAGCACLAQNHPTEIDDVQFHSLGVTTHPHYRRQGLGKAVVSALVEHVVREGGVALWSCDVLNVPSLRLARAVGFLEVMWTFAWGVSEGEMEHYRRVLRTTG